MCSTNTSLIGLSGMLMETAMAPYLNDDDTYEAMAAQYTSSLLDLERSQAQTRLAAQHSISDGVSAREKYQIQTAQTAGKSRTEHGASGLATDSGSILQLMADQAVKAQSESSDITRQTAQNLERQRLNEVYYGQKKSQLRDEYRRQKKNLDERTTLGRYNQIRGGLNILDSATW